MDNNHQVAPVNHQPVDLLHPKYHTYTSFIRPSTLQNANSTDPLKGRTSYRWSFSEEKPPNSSLSVSDIQGSRSTIAWFQPDVPGLYALNLAVKGHGCTYSDRIKVHVVDLDSDKDSNLLTREDLDQDFYVIGYHFSDRRPQRLAGPTAKLNLNTTSLKKQISSKKSNSTKDKIFGAPLSHKKNQLQKDAKRRKKPALSSAKSPDKLHTTLAGIKKVAISKLSAKGKASQVKKKAHDYDDDNDAGDSGADDDDEQFGKGGGYEDDDDEDLEGLESGDDDDENLDDAPGDAGDDNEGEDDGGNDDGDDGGDDDEGGDDDDGDQGDQGEDHDEDEEEDDDDNEIEIEEEEDEDGDDDGEEGGGHVTGPRSGGHDMEDDDDDEGGGMYDGDDGDDGDEEGEDNEVGQRSHNPGGEEEEDDDDMMDGDDYDPPQGIVPEYDDDEEGDGDGDGDGNGNGNEGGNDDDDDDDEDDEDDEDIEE